MTNIVLPYNPIGSTTKSIEGINSNFAAVAAVVNGELDHTNLAASAGVLPSQLDQSTWGDTVSQSTSKSVGTTYTPNATRATMVYLLLKITTLNGQANVVIAGPGGTPSLTIFNWLPLIASGSPLNGLSVFVPAGWSYTVVQQTSTVILQAVTEQTL